MISMWQIIFLAIFPHIIGVVVRPLDPVEGLLWEERLSESMYPNDVSSGNSESPKYLYPYYNYEITDADPAHLGRPPSPKRALSMFARWGSLSGIGKNRPPIRADVFDPEDAAISAQPRGRMLGQPLRWG